MSTSAESLAGRFVETVRSVVGSDEFVPLHAPEIGAVEREYVDACLESTFVSSVGEFVGRFEDEIAAFTGTAHAVAVSNGTSALQVALSLAGVRPGDEVLVPALSFIATANAVAHCGATPHFVDSDADTLGMSPASLADVLGAMRRDGDDIVNPATGARIAAIVPMHTFGHPVDIAGILELSATYGVPVVEDAAESLGSYVGDRHTGRFGLLSILSFNGNKILTTGGGGMILTEDAELGRRAKHLTTTAKLPHAWEFEHDEVAWNFRLPNLNAALGVAQFTRLPGFLVEKRTLAARYREAFADVDGFEFLDEPAGTTSNFWLCSVRLTDPDIRVRDVILAAAQQNGLQCRPFWNLLSNQRMYASAPRSDLASAEQLHAGVISMPSSPILARVR
jgi:perosamine synthetase